MDSANRHLCMIYDGPPTQHLNTMISEFLRQFSKKKRCMFLGSPSMIATIYSALKWAGIDVDDEVKKKSIILSSDQSHLNEGRFEPMAMIKLIELTVEQALADGYTGLWATGDMAWEFGSESNLNKLMEYECALERLFWSQPGLSGMCQYSKDMLPIHIMGDALLTHPSLYVNHTLHRANAFYSPPYALISRPKSLNSDTIQHCLKLLEETPAV